MGVRKCIVYVSIRLNQNVPGISRYWSPVRSALDLMLQGGIVEKGSHECRMEFVIEELDTAIISPFSAYQPDILAQRPFGPFGNKVRRHGDRRVELDSKGVARCNCQ